MLPFLEALIVPSGFCFALAAIGLALCVASRTRKAALLLLACAGLLFITFSSGKTATLLLSPLEYKFPRVPDDAGPERAIVLLTAYAADDPNMSLSDRPNSAALYRIVEAVLLSKRCKDCEVIVTGSSPTTNVMAELLEALGVPRTSIRLDSSAGNTSASAVNLRAMLGDSSFFLVTSAGHMPRAVGVFRRLGLHPVPAPTDHRLPKSVSQADWGLSSFHLECSDLAVHEYVGMWWYRARGLM